MALKNENASLEDLYNKHVMLDSVKSKNHDKVLDAVLKDVIKHAAIESPEFKEVYERIYYGGSYFDGLKVKSTSYEYDLNIVFKKPKTSWRICNLGIDQRKPNFASLKTNFHNASPAWKDLIKKDSQSESIISPSSMYKLLQTAVDRALTKINSQVLLEGHSYRVTRATGGAPVKLKVANAENNVNFTVDLVPAFAFDLSVLKDACSELFIRVKNMIKDYQISPEKAKSFMLIVIKKADQDLFEIDFHDIERELLKNTGGCVKKVIKMMKFLRDEKGGTINKLWSHLLKTSVMNHILRGQEENYWNNGNLTACFIGCLRNLCLGLHKEIIRDIFFPEFNMLDRLDSTVIKESCRWLDGVLKKYDREESVSLIFPKYISRDEERLKILTSKEEKNKQPEAAVQQVVNKVDQLNLNSSKSSGVSFLSGIMNLFQASKTIVEPSTASKNLKKDNLDETQRSTKSSTTTIPTKTHEKSSECKSIEASIKKLPEDPSTKHPVSLINEVYPGLAFECSDKGVEEMFIVTVTVNDQMFTGRGRSKKDAKKECCKAVAKELLKVEYSEE